MSKTNLSPVAAHVIKKCGGVRNVAILTNRATVSVHKWRHDKARGGTGGLIPSDAQEMLMCAALRGEIDLTPSDFFDLSVPCLDPIPLNEISESKDNPTAVHPLGCTACQPHTPEGLPLGST